MDCVLFSVLPCSLIVNKFTCVSGSRTCTPAIYICDGDNDCTDASDERYCDTGQFILFAALQRGRYVFALSVMLSVRLSSIPAAG